MYTCLRKNKHAGWIQLEVSVTDLKCGIGISSIFVTAYRYFPFCFLFVCLFVCLFVFFLRYCGFWYTPIPPSSTGSFTRGYNYRALTGRNFCVLDLGKFAR